MRAIHSIRSRDCQQVYMSVWLATPSVRPSLTKLYNTWQRYFPEDVLKTISQRQNAPEQVPHIDPATAPQPLL